MLSPLTLINSSSRRQVHNTLPSEVYNAILHSKQWKTTDWASTRLRIFYNPFVMDGQTLQHSESKVTPCWLTPSTTTLNCLLLTSDRAEQSKQEKRERGASLLLELKCIVPNYFLFQFYLSVRQAFCHKITDFHFNPKNTDFFLIVQSTTRLSSLMILMIWILKTNINMFFIKSFKDEEIFYSKYIQHLLNIL